MGGTVKVSTVNALSAGEKINIGAGLFARCNSDDTVTLTARIKREGKAIDITVDRVQRPLTRDTWAHAIEQAQAARADHRRRRPAAAPLQVSSVGRDASLADVWSDMTTRIAASGKWTTRNTKASNDRARRYLEPWSCWNKPVRDVTALDVANMLAPMAGVPNQMQKVRSLVSLVFTHAMALGLVHGNAAADAGRMQRVTSKSAPKTNFPTILDIERLRAIYKNLSTLNGNLSTRAAAQLQALTCQRTGEVVGATWDEFDLDAGVWTIPRSRMKMKDRKHDHDVPLSAPAVALLRGLPRKGKIVFPGRSGDSHTTTDTIPKVYRTDLGLDGEFVPHSWRSAFRTLANGQIGKDGRPMFAVEWLEAVLDHVAGAYDRGVHPHGERQALDWWARQLTGAGR